MEKQTTVLFSVALLKNQEKTQGRIQTTNAPRQQQQQNLERQHTQHHSIHKHNTCQDQPQFEHEIFQPNVRSQNSKEYCFQKKLKFFVGNFNKNTSEEDLYKLFGLRSTTYLKTTVAWKFVTPFTKKFLSSDFRQIAKFFQTGAELRLLHERRWKHLKNLLMGQLNTKVIRNKK